MSRCFSILVALIFFLLPPAGDILALVPEAGGKAPVFDLPLFDGGGGIDSKTLFASHELTFLVFWSSSCSHCIDALVECEEFDREYGGGDIEVAGINTDDMVAGELSAVLRAKGIGFMQLRDRGGSVASLYGVAPSIFTVFLVDGEGMTVARVADPDVNVKSVMERMMIGEEPEGGDFQYDILSNTVGLSIRGSVRLRFLSIDARGSDAVGPYGEKVDSRNDLLHRFELEIARRLGRNFRVGGLLRIGNEGLAVLRGGPEYFDSERGSVFAEIETGKLDLRFGYYTFYMTPLTLMRWDWDDNPRTGGDAGCGCGEAAGVLLVESLEQLGPELTFEGALASYRSGGLSANLFYAIPRRARDIGYIESDFGGEERACYSLEIFGGEALWNRYDERCSSFLKAGVHMLGSREDGNSVDTGELGYSKPFARHRSEIVSLTAEIPVVRRLSLRGEWIAYNRAKGRDPSIENDAEVETEGGGGMAGLIFEEDRLLRVRCDYLRIEDGFYSPFGAISYTRDREGGRISSRFSPGGRYPALSVFYKRLREIDIESPGAEREHTSLFGVSCDIDLESGYGASAGYLDKGDWRGGTVDRYNASRKAFTAGARYRFDNNSYMQLQYQRVNYSDDASGGKLESFTDLYSFYLGAVF